MDKVTKPMPNRQRFIDICHAKRPGDLYLMDWLYRALVETPEEWIKQGAPERIKKASELYDYFELDRLHTLQGIRSEHNCMLVESGLPHHLLIPPIIPAFPRRVLEEDAHYRVEVTEAGYKVKVLKEFPLRMPTYLDRPVKDWASWREYKRRLDPHTPERWPSDWAGFVKKTNAEDKPTMLLLEGFFGILREWTGLENLLYMFFDDPRLVEDMMDQVLYLNLEILKRVLKDIRVDIVRLWEDMCYKTGPLISPAMVRKFMMPRYKQVTDYLHSKGIDIIHLDSDGNINELVPLWMECGINFPWPFEVAAGSDVIAFRKKYGKNIILGGAIDKRVFAHGKKAIKQEVMSKVPYLIETGPFFPGLDHAIPPDISLENFRYFINLLREIGGKEKLPE